MEKQLLTASRFRAFRSCQKYHSFIYEIQRRGLVDAQALRFGRLLHAGLEGWWRWWQHSAAGCLAGCLAGGHGCALDAALAGLREYGAGVAGDAAVDEWDLLRAEELMIGYDARWSPAMAGMTVTHVEAAFRAPMRNPDTGQVSRTFELGGKVDAVAIINGEPWVIEHKSSSGDIGPASDYWLRLRIDGQVSMYYDGAANLIGAPVKGCIYDVIRKPGMRPACATPEAQRQLTKGKACKSCGGIGFTSEEAAPACTECAGSGWLEKPRLYANQRAEDETIDEFRERLRADIVAHPDHYFQRGEVVRLDSEMEEHRRDAWMTARHLRDCQLHGTWPRSPDACHQYGRVCSYWSVCTGAASIDDNGLFRDSRQHEELTQITSKAKEMPNGKSEEPASDANDGW